jgi:hypothetical protein
MSATTAPRRISTALLAMAESSGRVFHRSGTEQLEHWAALGAAVEAALGIRSVAKLKTVAAARNLDDLLKEAGTPAANARLREYLARQPYPQFAFNTQTLNEDVIPAPTGTGRKVKGRRR